MLYSIFVHVIHLPHANLALPFVFNLILLYLSLSSCFNVHCTCDTFTTWQFVVVPSPHPEPDPIPCLRVSRGLCLSMCLCCCLFVLVYRRWMSWKFVHVHEVHLPHVIDSLCSPTFLYMWYIYHMPIWLSLLSFNLSLLYLSSSSCFYVHCTCGTFTTCHWLFVPSFVFYSLYIFVFLFVTIVVFLSIPVVVGFQL